MRRFLLIWFACWGLFSTAKASRGFYVPDTPKSFGDADFYLVTVGVGREIGDRFGHLGIRFQDRGAGTDVVFNWGKYSFDSPLFLWRFFRGELIYSMGVRSFKVDTERYQVAGRRVVMNQLLLDEAEKKILFALLQDNAKPEHREFSYQYWFKNCATIPRDYLNQALSGTLEKDFTSKVSDVTYRHYVKHHLAFNPFVAPFLDVIMNGNIDMPITAWNEMFLPAKLRQHLVDLPAYGGRDLLGPDVVLSDVPESFNSRFADSMSLALVPCLLALLTLVSRFRVKASGFLWMLYGGLSGILGLIMLLNWFFSGHPDTWHNANLLLFWPIDLIVAGVGWYQLKRQEISPRHQRLVGCYVLVHVMVAAFLMLLFHLGWLKQDVGNAVFYIFTPFMVALALSLRPIRQTKPSAIIDKENYARSDIH